MSTKRWFALVAASTMLSTTAAQAAGPTVTTGVGTIQGLATAAAQEYLGIPYAKPPFGALRWKAPQPTSWTGVLSATALPSACPQLASDFGTASGNEDCLYLNVYTPPSGGKNLPVILWIHGGSDETGTGGQYDGTALVQDNVVVVTINYRLGFLGFLTHPALDTESPFGASGDYGLMDQQAAMRWVRNNIAAFGGDPTRVTIAGESAGAQNILDHLASPGATGLFQRAIVESGGYAVQLPSHKTADASGVAFATTLGCNSQTDATCLRNLTVAQVLSLEAAGASGSVSNLTQFEPTVGTAVLPVQPLFAIAAGVINKVPVLQGSNHDEARLFTALDYDFTAGGPLTAAEYETAVAGIVGAPIAPSIASVYPLSAYPSPDLAYSTLFTDAGFSCSARGFDQLLSKSVPVYNYEFADENAYKLLLPTDPYMPLGAPHTSELPFIWPNLTGVFGPSGPLMTADEMSLATQMRLAWTNFARTANPNGPGTANWPIYNLATDQFHEFVPPTATTNTTFNTDHKCNLWGPVLTLDGILPPGVL